MDKIAMMAAALRQVFDERAAEVAEQQAADAVDNPDNHAAWSAILVVLRTPESSAR